MTTSKPQAARARSLATYAMIGLFLAGLVLGLTGPDNLFTLATTAPVPWIAGVAAVVIVSTVVSSYWLNSLDELAQRAHYVAWYWGGSMGIAALILILFAAPALGELVDFGAVSAPFADAFGEASGFAAGVVVSLSAMATGYAVWWLIFWLRKQ